MGSRILALSCAIIVVLAANARQTNAVPASDVVISANPYTPPKLPTAGQPCVQHECKMIGYCNKFFTCNQVTNVWQSNTCGKGLYWNENADNGAAVHGGTCDFYNRLDKPIQQAYEGDENCISKCAWWQEAGEICTGNYHYRAPFNASSTTQVRESSHKCPKSSEGVQLLWDQSTLSCRWCAEVKNTNTNQPCTCT